MDALTRITVQLCGQGRHAEANRIGRAALAEGERALAARTRVLGTVHPDTLARVNNLAGLYQV